MKHALSALFALSLLLAGCASSSIAPGVRVGAGLPPPDVAQASQSREYLIAPLDTLEVSVFQVADLNRTVEVDANGQISLPLVGVLRAGGKSARAVSDDIAARLREGYVLSPQVNVAVKDSPNRRITVEGAVLQPGVFPIAGRTTLLQAIALAHGAGPLADERRVAIFRTVGNRRAAAVFDLAAIRQGKADDPEVFGNDVVVVERSGAKSLLGNIRSIIPVVGIFRWF